MDLKKSARWLIVPFALALVIILLMQISLSDIATALFSMSPLFLLLSFILYVLVYAIRAARFRIMLKSSGSFKELFNIVCLHNLANSVMPFRTGELSFVYMTKVRLKIPAGISLATVALARMYDALAVCIIFTIAFLMTYGSIGIMSEYLPIVIILMALLATMLVSVIWFSHVYMKAFRRLSGIKWLQMLPMNYLEKKINEVSEYYSSPDSKKGVIPVLLMSLAIWLLCTLSICALASSMGLGVSVWAIILGSLIMVMFSALPIHGIGSLGTTELIWSATFIALGATKEAAISSGFAIHILILLFSGILGLYSVIVGKFQSVSDNSDHHV
jgi:glycosyltransferase 2 family protein